MSSSARLRCNAHPLWARWAKSVYNTVSLISSFHTELQPWPFNLPLKDKIKRLRWIPRSEWPQGGTVFGLCPASTSHVFSSNVSEENDPGRVSEDFPGPRNILWLSLLRQLPSWWRQRSSPVLAPTLKCVHESQTLIGLKTQLTYLLSFSIKTEKRNKKATALCRHGDRV